MIGGCGGRGTAHEGRGREGRGRNGGRRGAEGGGDDGRGREGRNGRRGRGAEGRGEVRTLPKAPIERDRERGYFDLHCKNPNSKISDHSQALRLLKATRRFAEKEGVEDFLYRLASEEVLENDPISKSLAYLDASSLEGREIFMEFLPLLTLLVGSDDLGKPIYRKPRLEVMKSLHGNHKNAVVKVAFDMIEGMYLPEPKYTIDRMTLASFCTILKTEGSVTGNSSLERLARALVNASPSLKTVLEGASLSSVAGGRHDNDFADYRKVQIVPTKQEFVSTRSPHLPGPIVRSEAALLDRLFRLLREDMLGPVKDEMTDPRKLRKDLFTNVRVKSVHNGSGTDRNGKRTSPNSDPCILFTVVPPQQMAGRLRGMKGHKEREAFFESSSRILPKDGLICFLREDVRTGSWIPVRFGSIKRRDASALAEDFPVIGIGFFSEKAMSDTIEEMSRPPSSLPKTRMLMASSNLFAYEPVLRGLQAMTGVPFADEIVYGKSILIRYDNLGNLPVDIKKKFSSLDLSQKSALRYALKNRVALIQGPPGTGKTYVGAFLARIILLATEQTILCVCYTNHALDSFLEDLLDEGVTDIVRVGGKSKSKRLEDYNLFNMNGGSSSFTAAQKKRYGQLKGIIESAEKEVVYLQKRLSREMGAGWWSTVSDLLEDTANSLWIQLRVTDRELCDEQGFGVKGVEGNDYLWKCWLKNKLPEAPFAARRNSSLWLITPEERVQQKYIWQNAIYKGERMALVDTLSRIQDARSEISQLQDLKNSAILRGARVIGCTTTKAAMIKTLLDDVACGVLLVEEAAEIMESHVLTSLSAKCNHLIMIGDHKQLRPKAENYKLTVESQQGFDLNRSLFERLAFTLQISTLAVQHRMHPDISAIPKLITYPELQDAPSVYDRPSVRGLRSRVIFIDHDKQEDDNREEGVSKTNTHEVAMVVHSVRYLIQQGYKPSDMVILTPYLGQLLKIEEALTLDNHKALIGDLDFNEARSKLEGVGDFKLSDGGKALAEDSVRIATIDNFQGEQANIVIASLVRSNPSFSLGFLKEPERVNVLLSRARQGQIIIGNKNTLVSKTLWYKIFNHLEENDQVFDGLPAVCQTHGTEATLSMPGDFAKYCPEGGCKLKCSKELACGHKCPSSCHNGECAARCAAKISMKCLRGLHDTTLLCGSASLPSCNKQLKWQCNGRDGVVHDNICKCCLADAKRECKSCEAVEKLEQERLEKEKKIAEEQHRQVLEKDIRIKKADDAILLALQKQKNLAAMKAKEDEARLKEIEAWELNEMNLLDSSDSASTENIQRVKQEAEDRVAKTKKAIAVAVRKKEKANKQAIGKLERVKIEQEDVETASVKKTTVSKKVAYTTEENESYFSDRVKRLTTGSGGSLIVTASASWKNMETSAAPPSSPALKQKFKEALTNLAKITDPKSVNLAIEALKVLEKTEWPHASCYLAVVHSCPTHSNLYSDDAETEFSEYLSSLEVLGETPPPAVLLVAARLCEASDERFRNLYLQRCHMHETRGLMSVNEQNVAQGIAPSVEAPVDSEDGTPVGRWSKLQRERGAIECPSIDELMGMSGLNGIKEKALELYSSVLREQDLEGDRCIDRSFNFSLCGNPGVGKTTVAQIFGRLLNELGVRSSDVFIKTTGEKLARMGADKVSALIDSAIGGVLFIDEAYALEPKRNADSAAVAMQLLDVAEERRTELTIIIAGYQDDIEQKLFEFNDGFQRRFNIQIFFEDYTVKELADIFRVMCVKELWPPESEDVVSIAARRVGRGRGQKAFGNAGAVRNLFEIAYGRALDRDKNAKTLTTVDIIGRKPDCTGATPLKAAMDELDGLVGLEEVKKSIKKLVVLATSNYDREFKGERPFYVPLNRLFLGNPGTGKTTVALIYGRILKELGMLSNGKCENKKANDFMGSCVGETPKRTTALINRCQGKVLICDEAYALNCTYGREAIDTLVGLVSNAPGEDIAVIMIGYHVQMETKFRDVNPGFARRFSLQDAFQFDDFSDAELDVIVLQSAAADNLVIPKALRVLVIRQLAAQRVQPHFGNAGDAVTMVANAKMRLASRDPTSKKLTLADFGLDKTLGDGTDALQGLFKVGHIRKHLSGLRAAVEQCEREGEDRTQFVESYLFLGSPGTGKTTIAREMANMLHDLGVLATNKFVSCSGQDMQGSYVGQTKDKVNEYMANAQGGVLLIDEAYTLGGGTIYAKEAMDQLVGLMTEKEHKNRTVVILAGYKTDMERMLDGANQGVRSRFTGCINFPDWDADDCVQFISKSCEDKNIKMERAAEDELRRELESIRNCHGWANARDCETAVKFLSGARAQRGGGGAKEFTLSDVKAAMLKLRGQRKQIQIPQQKNTSKTADVNVMMAGAPREAQVGKEKEHVRQQKESDVVQEKFGVEEDAKDSSANSDSVFAALLVACCEEGYDSSHEKRRELVAILYKVRDGEDLPANIISRVIEKTRQEAKAVLKTLKPQVHRVLNAMLNAVNQEDLRVLRMEKLEEAARKAKDEAEKARILAEIEEKKALELKTQKRLKEMGVCCMGYTWHPCGNDGGWRCAGGSHYLSAGEVGL